MSWGDRLPLLVEDVDGGNADWSAVVRRAAELRRRRRMLRATAGLAPLAVLAALIATPAFGLGHRLFGLFEQPRRESVSTVFQLTPTHRSGAISHEFVHSTVGFYSTRFVVPRGLPAELLIRTSVESLSGQAPDVALCTPERLCRAHGLGERHQCRNSGSSTICEQVNPPRARDAIFPPGRFVMTVREFAPRHSRVSLKVVFIRGEG